MKYIKVSSDIEIINPVTKSKIPNMEDKTFAMHVIDFWLGDKRMGNSPKELTRLGKILDVVQGLKAGDIWTLEDSDYDKMKQIVEAPDLVYGTPLIQLQVLPFSEAFLNATDKAPEKAS